MHNVWLTSGSSDQPGKAVRTPEDSGEREGPQRYASSAQASTFPTVSVAVGELQENKEKPVHHFICFAALETSHFGTPFSPL